VQEVEQRYGVPVLPVFTFNDLIAYSGQQPDLIQYSDALKAYRAEYGV
jgi:orotate phosphoribosyltransferase